MQGVLTGFAVLATVIAVGYVLGRRGHLGPDGAAVLTRLAFNVATPALLFSTLLDAELSMILSGRLLITAIGTAAAAALFIAVAAIRSWSIGYTTVGALCSAYVNAGNLGIPIAAYVLGDASLIAPVMLFQQLIAAPIALAVLDLTREGDRVSLLRRLTAPVRNPVTIGALTGVAVAATGWTVPGPVLEPVVLIGNMAVPAVLLAFGISLYGSGVPGRGRDGPAVLLATTLKTIAQPLIVWALATGVFHLGGTALRDVVVTSALPAAQNIYTYAAHYRVAERFARDAVLLSTLVSAPVLVVVATLLG
ncbi:AEC family transporter [Streptomyces sp. A7024]|uniref:AEC family transporter n=1 Tax=Streptomyces coryli TaxID=1128680 RepID=A0A6G4TSL8_9ACTN|nr:AEC family transporter [Streptomyces coryli]NGN62772.1 AEC family transporter [Streptomyces coryli]